MRRRHRASACLTTHLEDLDLAGGGVEVLRVLFALVLFERVDLDAERNALLPAVLPHGELCADAVYLDSGHEHRVASKPGPRPLN